MLPSMLSGAMGMIRKFSVLKIADINFAEIFFQQDGNNCHLERIDTDLRKEEFDKRLISRSAQI